MGPSKEDEMERYLVFNDLKIILALHRLYKVDTKAQICRQCILQKHEPCGNYNRIALSNLSR